MWCFNLLYHLTPNNEYCWIHQKIMWIIFKVSSSEIKISNDDFADSVYLFVLRILLQSHIWTELGPLIALKILLRLNYLLKQFDSSVGSRSAIALSAESWGRQTKEQRVDSGCVIATARSSRKVLWVRPCLTESPSRARGVLLGRGMSNTHRLAVAWDMDTLPGSHTNNWLKSSPNENAP